MVITPVLFLVAAGLASFRGDRLRLENDTAERAQELADSLRIRLEKAWDLRELASAESDSLPPGVAVALRNEKGALVLPPPLATHPPRVPTGQEAEWWSQAEQAEYAGHDLVKARALYQRLAKTFPTSAGEARFALALLDRDAASIPALEALRAGPQDFTRSGLPVPLLATGKWLRLLQKRRESLDPALAETLAREAVFAPTPLSPVILAALPPAVAQPWQTRWLAAERGRRLAEIPAQPGPDWRWLSEGEWLVLPWAPVNATRTVSAAFSKEEVQRRVRGALESMRFPSWLQPTVELAGRPITPALAAHSRPLAEADIPLGHLAIHLVHPETLYAAQRRRQLIYAGLIILAAALVMVGHASHRRSLREQWRLNELKSDFVSAVSHELRAPLAAVRLMAESLERGKIPDEARRQEYFELIGIECRRLSTLVENVLDFSRIEQGRRQYQPEETALTALVEQTVRMLQPGAAGNGVRLEMALPVAPVVATLDAHAIQQALVNLIDNALKHSSRDSAVQIGLGESGGAIQLWVEDHGPGIPAAEHARIFERFYRLGSELRRETPGAGIGLSIVKHIAEAHGGRVLVRSAPSEGSRFTIELPLPLSPA